MFDKINVTFLVLEKSPFLVFGKIKTLVVHLAVCCKMMNLVFDLNMRLVKLAEAVFPSSQVYLLPFHSVLVPLFDELSDASLVTVPPSLFLLHLHVHLCLKALSA